MITIRFAEETDWGSIQKVIETAFSDEENQVIMNLAEELSKEITSLSIKFFQKLLLHKFQTVIV